MMCNEPRHLDCRYYAGPFTVVDAETRRPLRVARFHRLDRAFKWADELIRHQFIRWNDDMDYVVTNRRNDPVPRPHA